MTMKKIFSLALAAAFALAISACDNNGMIQTESGLQYKYNAKGNGQKVEEGSLVKAKLSLMVEDSVVWTTYNSPDSIFSFVVGYSSVIKGFEEMALLMREGDDVYVSIPDSLAYGSTGAGNVIPPNATIVYNVYEMVSVSAPKKMLMDTLGPAFQAGGAAQLVEVFESLNESGQTENYHMSLEFVEPFIGQLTQARQLESVEAIVSSFEKADWEGDRNMLSYYQIVSLEGQGRIDDALGVCNGLIEEGVAAQWLTAKIQQLEQMKAGE